MMSVKECGQTAAIWRHQSYLHVFTRKKGLYVVFGILKFIRLISVSILCMKVLNLNFYTTWKFFLKKSTRYLQVGSITIRKCRFKETHD